MSAYFQDRLREVLQLFRNDDRHPGYRRLLDAAIETGDLSVYQSLLNFSDWYDDHSEKASSEEMLSKVSEQLSLIEKAYQEPSIQESIIATIME